MEINVNEKDLQEITTNVVKRLVEDRYLKANRKGSREGEKEVKGDGFKQNNRVHKSQKQYSRNGKNKFTWNGGGDEDETI